MLGVSKKINHAFTEDFSYDVMAVKNIFNIVMGWKMLSNERKFSSALSHALFQG